MIYALLIFSKTCALPCEPIYVHPVPLNYEQCRHLREPFMWSYRIADKPIETWAVCMREVWDE